MTRSYVEGPLLPLVLFQIIATLLNLLEATTTYHSVFEANKSSFSLGVALQLVVTLFCVYRQAKKPRQLWAWLTLFCSVSIGFTNIATYSGHSVQFIVKTFGLLLIGFSIALVIRQHRYDSVQ